ncbi:MAG: TIGR03960 family B12-binding radical SAM protein [Selenomonadaceae bacterium]|nr:TIGR03960 family B12-binding radical SAM protein [Selenomonadaceae bacterium]
MQINLPYEILQKVTKPVRYTGGEFGSVQKNWDDVSCRMVLALPDVYEVGMSNLGLSILYGIMNGRDDTLCDRVYSVWIDMEREMREKKIPLFALESRRAVKDFDFFGLSLQYEMIFTNVLNMLDLAGISLHAVDRAEDEPFVIGGGPCVYNVEPVADFFDFFVIGEGEEILSEVAENFIAWKNSGKVGGRKGFLKKIAGVNGIYVPSFYQPIYDGENFIGMKILDSVAQKKIYKRVVKNLDDVFFVKNPIVPFIDIVHNRAVLELFRGCTRGCRFCQAGMCYRPVRERSEKVLLETARRLIDSTGYDEMSLTSLSSADYSCLNHLVDELQKDFVNERVNFSLPSLRIDSFSIELAEKLQAVRKSGLTFAPEAGTQRLRDVINKNVTEENLLDACAAAFQKGWKSVKLYFMMGLPTETDEDIAGIADLAQKVANLYREITHRRDVKVTLSVSCFVPKPFTPFQWFGQISLEEFERRQQFLKNLIRDRAITYNYHNAKVSILEGVIARGDRRLAKVIETAWKYGAKFDGWSDLFNFDAWQRAFEDCKIDAKYFNERERNIYEPLAWEHTSPAVSKNFLISELEKSQAAQTTRDCRRTSCTGCGVCMKLGVNVIDYNSQVSSFNLPEKFQSSTLKVQPTNYRAQIEKGEEVAFLSHLEYMNVFMSALLRSKLPASYSEGFNPHLKVSFATALGVGVTSNSEYVDFVLAANVESAEVMEKLNAQLPNGAKIVRIRKISSKTPALTALVDFSRYEIFVPFDGDFDVAVEAAKKFNSAREIFFQRVTPKKSREIEIKNLMAESVKVTQVEGGLKIKFGVKIKLDGTVKPSEVLKVLRDEFGLNVEVLDAKINRTALLSRGKSLLDR